MKIAIITHYYKSENYGGSLQAYALCRFLNDNSYCAEQLSFAKNRYIAGVMIKHPVRYALKAAAYPFAYLKRLAARKNNVSIRGMLDLRKKAFADFNDKMTPHSVVYDKNTIGGCAGNYDAFITGSDQVWNPLAYCPEYLLDFVPPDKIKMSYAASISQDTLTKDQLNVFKKSLADYTAVSVREESGAGLLGKVSPVDVKWVADPVILLSEEQWNDICTPREIEEKYIFCYFLGDDTNQRDAAAKFAARRKLKTVTMPHIMGQFRKCDEEFGDIKLYDVSPAQFISLLKYSEYVFTDSFHATAFSYIYKKQFFTFERANRKLMGTRIRSFCSTIKCENRFCDTREKESPEYILNLPDIDYTQPAHEMEKMKKESAEYLFSGLSGLNRGKGQSL